MLATCASAQRHNAVGKPLAPITSSLFGKGAFRDLPLSGAAATCRTFCMSKTSGQHILFGSGSDIYLSNNFGRSFYLSKIGVLPAGTAAYSSLISDDGQVVLLYGSGLGIAAHSFYLTTNAFASATDGTLLTASSTATTTASTFTLISACLSHSDAQYIFLSGSGSDGGVFVSSDRGTSFVKAFTSSVAHSCSCSPSGKLVVLSLNGGAPYYSSNFGGTFSSIGTTSYTGRRVFVHPDESYFAMRTTSSFVYVNLSTSNTTLLTASSASFELAETTSSPVLTNTQQDDDSTCEIDRNGRLYYISATSSKLTYGNNFSLSAQTEESAFSGMTFSDKRLAATTDGKFLLVYTGSTLRILKQFHFANAVTFLNAPVISSTGELSFTLQSADASLPLLLYWTPRTSVSQPMTYAAGTTSVTLPSAQGNFLSSQSYVITIATLTETNGLMNGRDTLAAINNKPVVTVTGGVGDIYTGKERYLFRSSGSFRVSQALTVNVLLIGGGGGGGGAPAFSLGDGAGGGGAGEFAYGTLSLAANEVYNITIGQGGNGMYYDTTNNANSLSMSGTATSIVETSTAATVASALGGGAGGHGTLLSGTNANVTGKTGGSSGGGCGFAQRNLSVAATPGTNPSGWTRLVNKGGNGENQKGGGGGGGAGGVGGAGGASTSTGSPGGTAGAGQLALTYFDSSTLLAAGGKGGNKVASGTDPSDGANAANNTGNGGEGGTNSSASRRTKGGNGGSGIAIILLP